MSHVALRIGRLVATACLFAHVCAALADGTTLRGAGASFPAPVYAQWATAYGRAAGVAVDYRPIGSGAGVDAVRRGEVDFGGTDVPLAADALARDGLLQFPAVVGGVVPVVNLRGIASGQLRLTGEVLADIYLGRVRKWNDEAIVALNPTIDLPDTNITVVHRADASGTTYLWSAFLAMASTTWKSTVGASLSPPWPAGVGDVGNEGVASVVQRTRGSIGYVEYAYARAHRLGLVALRNRAGVYVQPGRGAFESVVRAASWKDETDLRQSLVDGPGAASWPIVGASFVLVPAGPATATTSLAILKFFDWSFAHGADLADALDYVPLPHAAVESIERTWTGALRDVDGHAMSPPARR